MWTSVLAFFNGLLDLANLLLSSWHDSQERQAGRDEVALEDTKKSLSDLEKANEIEARPNVTDPDELLGGLRKPTGPSK